MKTHILVEGKSDKHFLDILIEKEGKKEDFIVRSNDGKHISNPNFLINKELEKEDVGRYCIVFDADDSYEKSKMEIEKQLGELKGKVDIFLFPNDDDIGNLETLLSKIAKHRELIDCFDGYVECIKSNGESFAKNIVKKSKIYAYFEAVNGKDFTKIDSKIIQENIDFDHKCLDELKKFLFNI